MAEDFQEKTEEATPKKLSDARKKGQVAKSQDFTVSLSLLASAFVLFMFGAYLFSGLTDAFRAVVQNIHTEYNTPEAITFYFREGVKFMVFLMLPIFLFFFVVAFVAVASQVGFVIAPEAMKPKWKTLNVFDVGNYKKFFGMQAMMRLFFGMGKLIVVGVVSLLFIRSEMQALSNLMKTHVEKICHYIAIDALWLIVMVALILVVLGVIDLVWQRFKFAKDMKMSKQEVKDERKQTEGDVQVKSRLRQMMQQFTQGRMKAEVPNADVVIANPVHFAIAIKYQAGQMNAPVCVAKGMRKIAESIKQIAKDNGVPIVENPPLAQSLFKTVEVGMPIPPNFYHAVAEVLAYVYRLNEKMASAKN